MITSDAGAVPQVHALDDLASSVLLTLWSRSYQKKIEKCVAM